MSQYLRTGAKGFVGSALALNLTRKGWTCVTLPYFVKSDPRRHYESEANPFMSRVDAPIGAVTHLAACIHVMQETHADPLAALRQAGVDVTLRLARQAAAGVERFVYMSSVKVNGDSTPRGVPFRELDIPRP